MYDGDGKHAHGGEKAVMTKPGKIAKKGKKQAKAGKTKNFKKE